MATVKRKRQLTAVDATEYSRRFENLRPEDLGNGRPGPGHRGRPSLTPRADAHSPSIHVRLPEQLLRELSKRADANATTVSGVVRDILMDHTEQPG